MSYEKIFLSIFFAALGISSAQYAKAQEVEYKLLNSNNILTIKSVYETTDNVANFRNFKVEATETGEYYVSFWLQPTKFANGRFTTFNVYVNGVFSGFIRTTIGNWQSATIETKPTLKLKKGINTISIATNAPNK